MAEAPLTAAFSKQQGAHTDYSRQGLQSRSHVLAGCWHGAAAVR